jgi:hypothetical protein
MQVFRWAIDGTGGSWTTTLEEANQVSGLSFGNWKISWSSQITERTDYHWAQDLVSECQCLVRF